MLNLNFFVSEDLRTGVERLQTLLGIQPGDGTTDGCHSNPHMELLQRRFISDTVIGQFKLRADILRKHTKAYLTTNGLFRYVDFSQHFSISPQEYLIIRRLEQAGLLWEQTDLSITEIAYRTGFASSSNFSKAFQKHYGILPKEYRRIKR